MTIYVAIQIGHLGATSQTGGPHEQEINLKVAPILASYLQAAGIKVGIYGANTASGLGYDAAISLHCDASGNSSVTGYSLGFRDDTHPGSSAFAARIKARYDRLPFKPFRGYNYTTNEAKYYWWSRLTTRCKVCLVEQGFTTNPGELAYLQAHPDIVARAIADGVLDYFNIKPGPMPKKQEDEMSAYPFNNVSRAMFLDCYRDRYDYYVTTEGSASGLVFTLTGHGGGEAATDGQSVSGLRDHNLQDILKQDRMKGIKGSYKLTVGCNQPINISIREVPKP